MSTIIDGNVGTFRFQADLAIDPALPDSKTATRNTYLNLKQVKDDDVQIVNGEIAVVERNITSVVPEVKDWTYDYKTLKSEITAIAKTAASAGSSLDGQILIEDQDNDQYLRIIVEASKVSVEKGTVAITWPKGGSTPVPVEWL